MYADGVQDKGPSTHKAFHITSKTGTQTSDFVSDPHAYTLLNVIGSSTLPDGKYLMNPATHEIEIQWIQGIGSEKVAAPQGRLMATVINGILSRKLPWGLVLLGVALVIVVELLGVRSLTFAVGAYLSIATTLAIFVGGVMRWMIDRALLHHHARQTAAENKLSAELWQSDRTAWLAAHPDFDPTDAAFSDPDAPAPLDISVRDIEVESEISPGSLYASGLIAAGGLFGLLGVCIKFYENYFDKTAPRFPASFSAHSIGHDWLSVLMFGMLAFSLYYFARKPLETE
jgi:hypothetical protein